MGSRRHHKKHKQTKRRNHKRHLKGGRSQTAHLLEKVQQTRRAAKHHKQPVHLVNSPTTPPQIIRFYANWCPHCVSMTDEWDKFKRDADIKVIDIEASERQESRRIQEKYGIDVRGYPMIVKIVSPPHGHPVVTTYEGLHNSASFLQFARSQNQFVQNRG